VFDLQKSLEKSNHNLQICQEALKKQLEFNIDLTEKIKEMEQQIQDLTETLNTKVAYNTDIESEVHEKQRIIDELNIKYEQDYKNIDNKLKQA
jgi:predicted RNase H-like nuclease (RuvC/YqgF family)